MTGIIILILLGILLFVIEFMLVPGITIAGIGGLVLTVLGVYKAFTEFGSSTGAWVLAGTIILSAFVIAMSLRAKTWKRLMLKTDVKGTVNEKFDKDAINVGDQGETITRLGPVGKILVNGIDREATSIDGYVDAHSKIEVAQIEGTQIKVKPIK